MRIRLIVLLSICLLMSISAVAQNAVYPDTGRFSDDYRYYDRAIDPELYLIRPGETLLATFVGTKLSSMSLPVGSEGKIIQRNLGVFDMEGKTLSEARDLLMGPLKSHYNADQIEISVGAPYQVAISVTGAVELPGIYKGFTSQFVSEIVEKAGGVSANGSTRRIVFSGGGHEIDVDLDRARYRGDNSANPSLYAGASVFVPEKSEHLISVMGEVNSPREIELLMSDDLDLILDLAGGVKRTGAKSEVFVLSDSDRALEGETLSLQAGDILMVPTSETMMQGKCMIILGAVTRPGRYEYASGMSLEDLIGTAGGLTDRANRQRLTVFRQPIMDEWGGTSDFRYPINNFYDEGKDASSFQLRPFDSVFVPVTVGYVRVSGFVRNPGYFMYEEDKDVLHYIGVAGGFAPEADRNEITLRSRISSATYQASTKAIVQDGDELIINSLMIQQ